MSRRTIMFVLTETQAKATLVVRPYRDQVSILECSSESNALFPTGLRRPAENGSRKSRFVSAIASSRSRFSADFITSIVLSRWPHEPSFGACREFLRKRGSFQTDGGRSARTRITMAGSMFNRLISPLLFTVLVAIGLRAAQNVGASPSGSQTTATIFDDITDARERRAFREVWKTSEPSQQRDLAIRFVQQYSRSTLLKEVYELAARASVGAGDLAGGVEWAKRCLR